MGGRDAGLVYTSDPIQEFTMPTATAIRATFKGRDGLQLAARIDLPVGPIRAFALFAHCFTCTKDILAAKRIAAGLANAGVGVMRFDFTGLGSSEGEFANTDFSSNAEDLVAAADYLRETYAAPAILIGHSLGGAAVLVAAEAIPEAKAVVTIGAPADVAHVLHQLGGSLDEIRGKGEALVALVRGDHEVNEAKLRRVAGVKHLAQAGPELIRKVTGADVGFAGPVGLKASVVTRPCSAENSRKRS